MPTHVEHRPQFEVLGLQRLGTTTF